MKIKGNFIITKLTIKSYLQFISLKKLFSQNTIYNSFRLKKKHLISIENIHSIKNMYTWLFEYMSLHLIWIDLSVLKVTKVKLSS